MGHIEIQKPILKFQLNKKQISLYELLRLTRHHNNCFSKKKKTINHVICTFCSTFKQTHLLYSLVVARHFMFICSAKETDYTCNTETIKSAENEEINKYVCGCINKTTLSIAQFALQLSRQRRRGEIEN